MDAKFFLTPFVLLAGCEHVSQKAPYIHEEKITLAKVQREVKVGMSSADVVEILGSPNMVTSDANHCETWVYDKISTEVSAHGSTFGLGALLIGGSGGVGAGGGGSNYSSRSNQKTLTIIIKFDADSKVKNFTYRASSF